MKRTSNMHWAKFAAGAAVGLGMLAGAASPALAEVTIFTIDSTAKLDPGNTGATVTGMIACDTGPALVGFTQVIQRQQGKGPQGVLVAATNLGTLTITCTGGTQGWAKHVTVSSTLLHKGGAGASSQSFDGTDVHNAAARINLIP